MMFADGTAVGDGTWQLNVLVEGVGPQQQAFLQAGGDHQVLRVTGETHIGGVMLSLVEALRNYGFQIDWSDHGLWWPVKNKWLRRTRTTLDQYGVQSDSTLIYTPMHKNLRVQLPDLQVREMHVDFSRNVFDAVVKVCKELKIRHSEELSLQRKLSDRDLKKNQGISATRREGGPSGLNSPHHHLSNNSLDNSFPNSPHRQNSNKVVTPQSTLPRGNFSPSPYGTMDNNTNSPSIFNANGLSPASMSSLSFEGAQDGTIQNSPMRKLRDGLDMLLRARGPAEKARLNAGWLDSSRSLMEQAVHENDLVLLRFKFFLFYDLNSKYDKVRINQLYEQLKWSLLAENVSCSDDQMIAFAALQIQIQIQQNNPEADLNDSTVQDGEDDIDAALTDLQKSLDGTAVSSPNDITRTPQLEDDLSVSIRSKKRKEIKKKRCFVILKDCLLEVYESASEVKDKPQMRFNVKGCEVMPEVKELAKGRMIICCYVSSNDGVLELRIKTESEHVYAKWLAALRLASRGKTMADHSYDSEVKDIESFLRMQRPGATMALSLDQFPGDPQDYVCPGTGRKFKNAKQLAQRILEAHGNVKGMTLTEAKMAYIKAWQSLPKSDFTYFIVKFKGQKREELLAITPNRLVRLTLDSTEDVVQTYRFDKVNTWNVNWHAKMMIVELDTADDNNMKKKDTDLDNDNGKTEHLAFQSLTTDCKIVHEFIGGYMFLAMRSKEKNQTLNEELFHKLTGGWE